MTPPAAAPAVRARTLVPGAPLTRPTRPRRVSGPVRRPVSPPATRRSVAPGDAGVLAGLLEALQRVSSHRLLDRLIRGRSCIALVAFALIGIVTLQLELLKLNAGIGRSLERSALLQRENATLSIENSELAAGNRVESTASRLGMQLVTPSALRFLSVRGHADSAAAAASLNAAAPHISTASGAESSTASTAASSASGSSAGTPSSESTSGASPSGESTSGASASSESPASESSATRTPSAPASSAPAEQGAAAAAQSPSAASAESSSTAEQSPAAHESAPAAPASSPSVAAPSSAPSEATPAGGTQAGPAG